MSEADKQHSEGQKDGEGNAKSEEAPEAQTEGGDALPGERLNEGGKAKGGGNSQKEGEKGLGYKWQRPDAMTVATSVIAVFTIVLAGASIYQGWVVRSQLKEMGIQNTNIETQAGLMEDQLVQMQTALKTEQRAWVGVLGVEQIGNFEAGERPGLGVRIQNVGPSPARLLTVDHGAYPEHPSIPPAMLLEDCVEQGSGSKFRSFSALAPTVIAAPTSYLKHPLTEAELEEIKNGSLLVRVVGMIRYRDIFDETGFTSYCYAYDPTLKKWYACESGNEMK